MLRQGLDEHFIAAMGGDLSLQGALAARPAAQAGCARRGMAFFASFHHADVYSRRPFLLLLAPCTVSGAQFLKTLSAGTSESPFLCLCGGTASLITLLQHPPAV